jgi:integrase/recombinase XerC
MRLMDAAVHKPFDVVLRDEAAAQGLALGTADHVEGVEAFLEDRDPEFEGRCSTVLRLAVATAAETLARIREPLAASTISVKLSAAKALYRALRHVDATEATPFADLSAPVDTMAPEAKREAYTVADVHALLVAAEPVDRAFVHLCVSAGLRNFEATSLTWGQVRPELGVLKDVIGKGRRVRDVPAASALLAALADIRPAGVAESDPVLPFGPARARERLQRLCTTAGVRYSGREVHGLRHTAGTEITRRHGIDAAADILRHANLQTTRRYSKRTAAERLKIADDLADDVE